MILAKETPDDDDFEDDKFNDIYQSAIDLYGQLHARFILSSRGLEIMKEKYLNGDFGICPRLYCDEQPVIPIGLAKEIREEGVRTYCPRCKEAYIPSRRYENVDGVCFGSSFPLILLESHTELYPEEYNDTVYIPKIFGYKIYKRKGSAYYEKYTEKIEETKDLEESML